MTCSSHDSTSHQGSPSVTDRARLLAHLDLYIIYIVSNWLLLWAGIYKFTFSPQSISIREGSIHNIDAMLTFPIWRWLKAFSCLNLNLKPRVSDVVQIRQKQTAALTRDEGYYMIFFSLFWLSGIYTVHTLSCNRHVYFHKIYSALVTATPIVASKFSPK